jgi:hypothetical protein
LTSRNSSQERDARYGPDAYITPACRLHGVSSASVATPHTKVLIDTTMGVAPVAAAGGVGE